MLALNCPRSDNGFRDASAGRADLAVVDPILRLPGRQDTPLALRERKAAHRAGVEVPPIYQPLLKSRAPIAGQQQHRVPPDVLPRRAIENREHAVVIHEGAHPAATAGSGRLWVDLPLAGERLAVVAGVGQEDSASCLSGL